MSRFQVAALALLFLSVPPVWAASQDDAVEVEHQNFKAAYAAGNEALRNRDFKASAGHYEAAEKLATTNKGRSQAANAAGWAFLQDRQWDKAKTAFARSVSEDDQNKVALKNLGVVNFRLYEYGFADLEALKEAVKHLEASGENQEILERAQGALAREEMYAKATPVEEVNGAGMSFKALLSLGDQLQAQGRFEDSIKIFKQAESVAVSASAKGAAANRQGKVLLDARKPHESVPHFERAVKYYPEEKVYQNNLGFSYWVLYDSGRGKAADLVKAVAAFYKVNSIDPSYHTAMFRMALEELRQVDPEAAKAYSVQEESPSEGAGSSD